jgi:hypothetical protein
MIAVPDDKAITGLGRKELIALIRSLEKERAKAVAIIRERARAARERWKMFPKDYGKYLDDGDTATFYDVLADEIENS